MCVNVENRLTCQWVSFYFHFLNSLSQFTIGFHYHFLYLQLVSTITFIRSLMCVIYFCVTFTFTFFSPSFHFRFIHSLSCVCQYTLDIFGRALPMMLCVVFDEEDIFSFVNTANQMLCVVFDEGDIFSFVNMANQLGCHAFVLLRWQKLCHKQPNLLWMYFLFFFSHTNVAIVESCWGFWSDLKQNPAKSVWVELSLIAVTPFNRVLGHTINAYCKYRWKYKGKYKKIQTKIQIQIETQMRAQIQIHAVVVRSPSWLSFEVVPKNVTKSVERKNVKGRKQHNTFSLELDMDILFHLNIHWQTE